MEQIIERLRAEKAESENEMAEWGRKEGLEWAKSASYDDIQFALKWDVNNPISDDSTFASKDLNTYFHELFSENETLLGYNDDEYDCWVDESTLIFLSGWKEAVEGFWEQVKDKL